MKFTVLDDDLASTEIFCRFSLFELLYLMQVSRWFLLLVKKTVASPQWLSRQANQTALARLPISKSYQSAETAFLSLDISKKFYIRPATKLMKTIAKKMDCDQGKLHWSFMFQDIFQSVFSKPYRIATLSSGKLIVFGDTYQESPNTQRDRVMEACIKLGIEVYNFHKKFPTDYSTNNYYPPKCYDLFCTGCRHIRRGYLHGFVFGSLVSKQ